MRVPSFSSSLTSRALKAQENVGDDADAPDEVMRTGDSDEVGGDAHPADTTAEEDQGASAEEASDPASSASAGDVADSTAPPGL